MKTILYYFFLLAFIWLAFPNSIFAQCGNNNENGPDCDGCEGSNPINPYTGNVRRIVNDLEVWGVVGEIPLTWIRYGNSRGGDYTDNFGEGHHWNASFFYTMTDAGYDSLGRALINIHYPEGGQNLFIQSLAENNLWLPAPGIGNTLTQQNKNNFILQMPNGHQCHFKKMDDGYGNSFYQLSEMYDSKQNRYVLSYDEHNRLIRVTEPAGRYIQIEYGSQDGFSVISRVSSFDGRSVRYRYSTFNDGLTDWVLLDSVKYEDGANAVYTYSQKAQGLRPRMASAYDPRYTGPAVWMQYVYDDSAENIEGFIKEERNGQTGEVMATVSSDASSNDDKVNRRVCYPNGSVHQYIMPGFMQGATDSYTDGLGRETKYRYQNDTGFLASITDPEGRLTKFQMSLYGNPLKISFSDSSNVQFERDDLDLITRQVDELGHITKYTRDAKHLITHIDYPDSTYEEFTYNDYGQMLTHTRRNGGIEEYTYNQRGLLQVFTDAEKNITKYEYDSSDRLAILTDARGNKTKYEYNDRGLVTKQVNADDSKIKYEYDVFGNRTSTKDELLHEWLTHYDIFRRPDTLTDPLGRKTVYEYELPNGTCGCQHIENKPSKIILPSGRTTFIEYDVEWQKMNETTGWGTSDAAITSYEYDMAGNLTTMVDPRLNEWTYQYDVRNRKIKSSDPLDNTTQWVYDAAGNILQVIRPDTGITYNEYDAMNRLKLTTDPKGQVTQMKYDAEGNMKKLIDPKSNSYAFNYDLLNRKTKMIYPDSSFESYGYDSVSNMIQYANRNGNTRTYQYDVRNREIKSSWNDGTTPAIKSSYDDAGRLIQLSSNVSTIKYSYDDANELTAESQKIKETGKTQTIRYGYNEDGLKDTMLYPSNIRVAYAYTQRNQLSTIATGGNKSLAAYTYDLNGNRITKTIINGTNTDYVYDDANRLLTVDNKTGTLSFAKFDYGYNNVSMRTYMQRDNAKGDAYSYDAIDQVTDVLYNVTDPGGTKLNPDRTVNYIYDPSGNRNSLNDNSVTTNYIANNLNQYTAAGNDVLTYDKNGNLQTQNGWTYTYDAQNRMIKATNGTNTVDFGYDPRNRCVKRIINGTTTYYYFDDWNMIEERNATGILTASYIHGAMIDEVISMNNVLGSFFYHHDALGSIIALTNKNGNAVEKYTYDVFGAPAIKDKNGNIIIASAFGNRFMFTGREYIQELSLCDYRNRMYSPGLGRFLQIDPLRFKAGDYNYYRYVINNSINKKDSFGTDGGTNNTINITITNSTNTTINIQNSNGQTGDDSYLDLVCKLAKKTAEGIKNLAEKIGEIAGGLAGGK